MNIQKIFVKIDDFNEGSLMIHFCSILRDNDIVTLSWIQYTAPERPISYGAARLHNTPKKRRQFLSQHKDAVHRLS